MDGGFSRSTIRLGADGRTYLANGGGTAITLEGGRTGIGVGAATPITTFHVQGNLAGAAATIGNHVAVIENTAGADADVLALRVNIADPVGDNNFITFFGSGGAIGRIEGAGGGSVALLSGGADFAECILRDEDEPIGPGRIVGVRNGRVSLATDGADSVLVTTDRAIVGRQRARKGRDGRLGKGCDDRPSVGRRGGAGPARRLHRRLRALGRGRAVDLPRSHDGRRRCGDRQARPNRGSSGSTSPSACRAPPRWMRWRARSAPRPAGSPSSRPASRRSRPGWSHDAMARPSITIDRFHITALAARDLGASDRLKAKLDGVNAASLGAALAKALGSGSFAEEDPRVILLRRLNLDLIEAVAADAHRLAEQLAAMLAAALARIAEAPAEDLVTYESPAAYLAAFVRSVARGDPWGRWWFARFEGLKFLTASACIRTALIADPELGLAALLELPAHEQAQTLRILSASDVLLLLDAFGTDDGPTTDLAPALAAVASGPRPEASAALGRATLQLFLAGLAADPAQPRAELMRAAELVACWLKLEPGERAALARAVRGQSRAALVLIPAATLLAVAPLLSAPAAVRRNLHRLLTAGPPAGPAADQPQAALRQFTRFAGLLMLVPGLPEGLDPVLAQITLAICAGPRHAADALADPVIARVFGAPEHATLAELPNALAGVDTRQARDLAALGARPSPADSKWLSPPPLLRRNRQAVRSVQAIACAALRDLARRLAGFSGASAAFLWTNLLGVGGEVEAVGDGFRVRIERPPLDVLLAMSGLADRDAVLLDGRPLRLERAP
jgi:hypothetical protein